MQLVNANSSKPFDGNNDNKNIIAFVFQICYAIAILNASRKQEKSRSETRCLLEDNGLYRVAIFMLVHLSYSNISLFT